MKDCLPTKLNPSFRIAFFYSTTLQWRIETVNRHIEKINAICLARSVDSSLSYWRTSSCWFELRQGATNKEAFEKLFANWKAISGLAHLDSRALVRLYEDHLVPFEAASQHCLGLLLHEGLRPGEPDAPLPVALQSLYDSLKANLSKLVHLKKQILTAMVERSLACEQLGEPRQVDDSLRVIVQSLNDMGVKTPALGKKSCGLDEDTRLVIVEIGEAEGVEKTILTKLKDGIPKKGRMPLISDTQRNEALQRSIQQSDATLSQLKRKNLGLRFLHLRHQSEKSTVLQTVMGLVPERFKKTVSQLWQLRFLVYLGLTLTLYHYLYVFTYPILSVMLTSAQAASVMSVIFYAGAFSPIWWFGFTVLSTLGEQWIESLSQWKVDEISQALTLLENNERFISVKLAHPIRDFAHFDLQGLNKRLERVLKDLDAHKKALNTIPPLYRFLFGNAIHQCIERISQQIDAQKKKTKTQFAKLHEDLALHIGEQMEVLQFDKVTQKYIPVLTPARVQELKESVEKYGGLASQEIFERNANIMVRLVEKLKTGDFRSRMSYQDVLMTPWSSHVIRDDALNGYGILLTTFTSPLIRKEALLLHDVLTGKKACSASELSHAVKACFPNSSEQTLSIIQDFLYRTLSMRPAKYAALLSVLHKKRIQAFARKHKAEIAKADNAVQSVFLSTDQYQDTPFSDVFSLSEAQLARYYALLDVAELDDCTRVGNASQTRRNLARSFFEQYEGERAVYYYTRFLPLEDKNDVMVNIAQKRINWIMNHLSTPRVAKEPFFSSDIELFHNARLLEEGFILEDAIQCSTSFGKPCHNAMLKFLQTCKRKGLVTEKLVKQYSDRANMKMTSQTISSPVTPLEPEQSDSKLGHSNGRRRYVRR